MSQQGICVDPEKTIAVMNMPNPKDISELRRLLGIIIQFGKFSPNLSHLSRLLRDLLSQKNTWLWGPIHDQAFATLTKELTNLSVLVHYDPSAEISRISADASSFGLGAVLLQKVKEH